MNTPPIDKKLKIAWHTPEELIEILHSITALELDKSGCLDTGFDNETDRSSTTSFQFGSFTRLVLELIEAHLNKQEVFIAEEDDDSVCDD